MSEVSTGGESVFCHSPPGVSAIEKRSAGDLYHLFGETTETRGVKNYDGNEGFDGSDRNDRSLVCPNKPNRMFSSAANSRWIGAPQPSSDNTLLTAPTSWTSEYEAR